MTQLNVATVETPTTRYIKAKAELHENLLRVTDRRGREILTVNAPQVLVGSGHWTYGDVVVRSAGGCGCGNTRTEQKVG